MKLFEIKKKTQSQTRTRARTQTADPFDDVFGMPKFADQDFSAPAKVSQETPTKSSETPDLRKATAQKTRQAASQINMPPEAGEKIDFIRSLKIDDEISDLEALRRAGFADDEIKNVSPTSNLRPECKVENLPAIINKDILAAGRVEPEWHQVKHLPGYLQKQIRAIGRQVFGTFTNTPIEDIQVLANIGGHPNSSREMNAVAAWIDKNGTRYTEGEMEFGKSIPDYGAKFSMYKAKGYTFLIVIDFAGSYIYVWPTCDEKGDERHKVGIGNEFRRRLGRE